MDYIDSIGIAKYLYLFGVGCVWIALLTSLFLLNLRLKNTSPDVQKARIFSRYADLYPYGSIQNRRFSAISYALARHQYSYQFTFNRPIPVPAN